ncbi:unnamed protein product [Caenorhabditis angaria]|uniref:Protein kinase domain-containing protein n=1 Tax=Caenorhabditis angaria TaxID=860376 RepID=A0A9P1IQG5_9PELO|nr:unnamed protein product [Caenorhabditis angaria]
MEPIEESKDTKKSGKGNSEKRKLEANKELERERTKNLQNSDMPKTDKGETHIESSKGVYEIKDQLGQGSFGAVFMVKRESDRKHFAMKCESIHVKKQILAHEARVLIALNMLNSVHFAELVDLGKLKNRFAFIVLKLVGMNLWDIRIRLPNRKYTLNTALKIGEQTLEGIRDLHRVGFLHRDIKPPNFAIGREEDSTHHIIYVLDFGLSRKICSKGVDLRSPRTTCAFRGTTRYAALAAHDMREQSRKDDIESWWYMFAEGIVSDLPWKTFKGTDRDGVKAEKKKLRDDKNAMKNLFTNFGCYDQMSAILTYLDSLSYQNIPDYDYVYNQIISAAQANGCSDNKSVDWDKSVDYKGPKYKTGEAYIVKQLQ